MFCTPKTIEMQNTTLCLISLNNACCCSDSSFLIHQNPLSHYSVISTFLSIVFLCSFQGALKVRISDTRSLRIVSAFPILQNDTVCKSTVKSYAFIVSDFSVPTSALWILCILRFVPLFFLHLRFHADARPWNPNASFCIRVSLERR